MAQKRLRTLILLAVYKFSRNGRQKTSTEFCIQEKEISVWDLEGNILSNFKNI